MRKEECASGALAFSMCVRKGGACLSDIYARTHALMHAHARVCARARSLQ